MIKEDFESLPDGTHILVGDIGGEYQDYIKVDGNLSRLDTFHPPTEAMLLNMTALLNTTPMYKDRNDHYVPERRIWEGDTKKIVDISPEDPSSPVLVTEDNKDVERRLTFALPDELNRDPNPWRWAYYPDDGGDHWSNFRGEEILIDIGISTNNYREVNSWKGRDEIRSRTKTVVYFNRLPVWDSSLEMPDGLINLHQDIKRLLELEVVRSYALGNNKIVNRKVYWNGKPGIITRFIGDQGCVIIEPDDVTWEPMPWNVEDERDFEYLNGVAYVKERILSSSIWWWRD